MTKPQLIRKEKVMNNKTLVILAGIAMFLALFAFTLALAPQVSFAQNPTPAPQPPVAVLKVVAVPANAADTNAITATYSYITDTAVGAANSTVAMGTTGLSNTPINVPIHVSVSPADPKNTGKPTWTLTPPPGSKAAIKDPTAMATEFTPDVVGAYQVGVSLKSDAGLTSASQFAFFNAGTFIGMAAGNCLRCHPTKVAGWATTGHAKIITDEIDNNRTPAVATRYSETCTPCHTTGWYVAPVGAGSGGFLDAKTTAQWTFPTFAQIDAAGTKTGSSNWAAAPDAVKNMGNIQCEQCHGPASEHVKNRSRVMAVSFDNGVCEVCHASGGIHVKGIQVVASPHSNEKADAWNIPTGPAEQACVRCHTAKGYVSFLANPTKPAAWNNEKQTLGCAGCHDPHSDANYAELRVVGMPVQVPFAAKDVGLSATCETCHNNRTTPEDATQDSYPHELSAAEMLTDVGGVTYGQTVPNSPHGTFVGVRPIPNPAFAKDPTTNQFLFSAIGDTKGNVPGPCVTCHMTAGPSDAKDPNQYDVGGHSFNTVNPANGADYTAVCQSCHGKLASLDFTASADGHALDYDGNGKVEGVQTEVKGLLDVLWQDLVAKGLKKIDTGFPYATVPATADDHVKNAWYNYCYVYGVMWGTAGPGNQGAAAAIHNFRRSVALLQLSIKDLTGSLPAGMTDGTK
jgi:hypothetical protein